MNDDFSNLISNFSKILEDKNIDLNSIINSSKNSSNFKGENDFSTSSSNPVDNSSLGHSFDGLDINTLLKVKSIMSKINSCDDYRSNLLLSLKPYLRDSKKKKVDQYIQVLKMLTIFESLDLNGGNSNDVS